MTKIAVEPLIYMSGGGSPVSVDGTLFIMLLLFLGLMVLLNRVLYRPYLTLKSLRDDRIDGARKEAQSMQGNAAEVLQTYEDKLTEARQQATQLRAELRHAGKEKEAEILREVRE